MGSFVVPFREQKTAVFCGKSDSLIASEKSSSIPARKVGQKTYFLHRIKNYEKMVEQIQKGEHVVVVP